MEAIAHEIDVFRVVCAALLAALIVFETVHFAEVRDRLRHEVVRR